jgi:hypothetical protein
MGAMPPVTRLKNELDPESDMFQLFYAKERLVDWVETFLTIPDERGRIVKMRLFPQQKQMAQNQTFRDITVKGRQTRASSFLIARNFRRMTTEFGLNAFVITEKDSTTEMFRARVKHHLKDLSRAGFDFPILHDNNQELVIGGLENRYIWASAEQRVAGRGYAVQILHGSEVAHWTPEMAGEIYGGILPSIPDAPYGWIDMESTPKGAEGLFYDLVQESRPLSQYGMNTTHLYPWWLEPRYNVDNWEMASLPEHYHDMVAQHRNSFVPDTEEQVLMMTCGLTIGQIIWRRLKIIEMSHTTTPFKQEYVEDIESCFMSSAEGFFASTDGIDHLLLHRQNILPAIKVFDELPYRNGMVSFRGGHLEVWSLPNAATTYAMYQDSSKGGTSQDSDPSVIFVMDARTGQHVAKLVVKAAPREVGEMGCAIGSFYHGALYGGERDAWGQQALDRVQELSYPNIYYTSDPTGRKDATPWIYPTEQVRNRMLQIFRDRVFDHTFVSKDRTLWSECGSFTWQKVNDRWKARASGKRTHDDHVIGAAGCCMVAERAQFLKPKRAGETILDLEVGPYGQVMRDSMRPDAPAPWFR